MNKERLIQLLEAALSELRSEPTSEPVVTPKPVDSGTLVWGAKVSQVFKDRVRWIADTLGFDPNWLMACMAFESGETFRANIRNAAGSGAVGLIQFMPATAKALGTSTAALSAMTPEDQLKYVYKYFEPYRGRLQSLDDLYMAILWPKAVGKPGTYQLFVRGGIAYRQNAGLDRDKDGVVTKLETCAKIREKYERGHSYSG